MIADTDRGFPDASRRCRLDGADCDRFAVALHSTRFWRPGEVVWPGDLVGTAVDSHRSVRASSFGRVVSIEYDVDRDELILLVAAMGPVDALPSRVPRTTAP